MTHRSLSRMGINPKSGVAMYLNFFCYFSLSSSLVQCLSFGYKFFN